jgi:transaldolase
MAKQKAIFLDRDGVLNALVYYASHDEWESPRRPEDVVLLDGVADAIRRIHDLGYLVFVVSNQPSAAKGKVTRAELDAVHEELVRQLGDAPIAQFFYCYHRAEDACDCRKPRPQVVLQAAREYDLDLRGSWFAGDQDGDIGCGRRAGTRTALLQYARSKPKRGAEHADLTFNDLTHFVRWLVQQDSSMSVNLRIDLYADGANVGEMKAARESGIVKGFTTNPTLMRKSGINDYEAFAHEALAAVEGMPISFEVFADDFAEMERQARLIATWGDGVFVKIPVTNTKGESAVPLIRTLSSAGVKLNVTAILSLEQVRAVVDALDADTPAIVSVFAGRVADTGRDPVPLMTEALAIVKEKPKAQLLWASPRELLNIMQADACGCHIITVTPDLLKKLSGVGRSLEDVSLDTVKMFFNDASAAGFRL